MKRRDASESRAAEGHGVRAELRERGLEPKRTLGQNFLADTGLCEKIAALACPAEGGSVLEIGAGLGALTLPLLARGARVVAVETDANLAAALRAKLARELEAGQLEVLEADVRELDLRQTLGALSTPRTLAGNLPYHLSGLLLRRAVELRAAAPLSVFLLQLEVVERLCAEPSTSAYGALTVFARAVYAPRRAFIVRRGAFYPQPSVDSAVVVLTPLAQPFAISDEFTQLVRAAFEKRRKTLRNAWRDVLGLELTELEAAAKDAEVELGARGETLAVADFDRMARELERFREARRVRDVAARSAPPSDAP
jgi:16S rRNA (adenine1518-N6/adenine1519-N6)-dimethyltransferase